MEFIINNWSVMVGFMALGAAVAIAFSRFVQLPGAIQLEKVQSWLLLAVSEAERELGGGTGELKLRKVYDKFLGKFPWLARVISFKRFVGMVRKALAEMETMLSENPKAKAYVEGFEAEADSIHAFGVPGPHCDMGVLEHVDCECTPIVHAVGSSTTNLDYDTSKLAGSHGESYMTYAASKNIYPEGR